MQSELLTSSGPMFLRVHQNEEKHLYLNPNQITGFELQKRYMGDAAGEWIVMLFLPGTQMLLRCSDVTGEEAEYWGTADEALAGLKTFLKPVYAATEEQAHPVQHIFVEGKYDHTKND